MSDRYTIETPENITFAYDIAGIGSRFLAGMIDTIIIIVGQVIILLVIGLAIARFQIAESLLIAGAALFGFLALWGYYIAFEMAWNGQSPGKRILGLRVVREGGRPITLIASVIRNLIRFVDFLPLFYGIGVVAMFADGRARRLGDLAAGVLVVRERGEVTLASLTATGRQPAWPDTGAGVTLPGVVALTDRDYALVEEFLTRRGEFGKLARTRLAAQLARGLEQRLGLDAGENTERFLEQVVVNYRLVRRESEETSG